MKLQYVSRRYVSHVVLQKDGKSSIGIDVKGDPECENGPVIKTVKSRSLAHRSQCIAEGDVILSLCGRESRGMSRKDVKQLMKETSSSIALKLQYEILEPCLNSFRVNRLQRIELKLRKDQDSFGFTLRKNGLHHSVCSEYPLISNIRQRGPADKVGSVKAGDHLVQIDDTYLSYLSLMDVANILREKEEAVFVFQYNIAIADSYIRPGESNVLEIDCPGSDLGVTLTSSLENTSLGIFIKEIRRGSLAERCGVLQVGDVIDSINDIDTALLTPSKANDLLHGFKRNPGKLSFTPRGRMSPMGRVLEKNLSGQSSSPGNTLVPPDAQSQLHNSPESLYQTLHAKRTSSGPKCDYHVYELQIKTISMLQDVIENISHLKHFIPFLECNVNHDGDPSETKVGSATDNLHMSPGKLSQMTAAYTRTRDSAYAAGMYLIKSAVNFLPFDDDSQHSSNVSCRGDGNRCHVRNNLLHILRDNLTEIYTRKFISKSNFDRLVENVEEVDLDCWECSELCVLAALTTQNVLLFLSLPDSKPPSILPIVKKLVDGLLNLKIPCEDCRKAWCSVSQLDVSSTGSNATFSMSRNRSLFEREQNCSPARGRHGINCAAKQSNTESPNIGLNITHEIVTYNNIAPRRNESNIRCNNNCMINSNPQMAGTNLSARTLGCVESCQINKRFVEGGNSSTAKNYNLTFADKFQKEKNFPPSTKQNWKSAEVISDSRNSSSVIHKHASIPEKFDERLQPAVSRSVYCQTEFRKPLTSDSAVKNKDRVDNPLSLSMSSTSSNALENEGFAVHHGKSSIPPTSSVSLGYKDCVVHPGVTSKPSTSISALEVKGCIVHPKKSPILPTPSSSLGYQDSVVHPEGRSTPCTSCSALQNKDCVVHTLNSSMLSTSSSALENEGSLIHSRNPSTQSTSSNVLENKDRGIHSRSAQSSSFELENKTLVRTIGVANKVSTVEVMLKNDGRGYGLDICFESDVSGSTLQLPTIKAIQSQSVAEKSGILIVGDKVLKVNGQCTAGLSPQELESLVKDAFGSNEMKLLVEFYLEVHEVKYGTFDIFVDSAAKAGLLFTDFRKDAPLMVKGVVKGSAAHRTGQLFAGDEILYVNCLREEMYSSVQNVFRRKNTLIFTVKRTLTEDKSDVSQECKVHLQPPSSPVDNDHLYKVNRVSTGAENGAVILDHEVTLFRDPTQKDFGFLISTDRSSGQVYVDSIRPTGPADSCKVMKKNDIILEINGKDMTVSDETSILSTYHQLEDRMDLVTRRILQCQ